MAEVANDAPVSAGEVAAGVCARMQERARTGQLRADVEGDSVECDRRRVQQLNVSRLEATLGKRYSFAATAIGKFEIYDKRQQPIIDRLTALSGELKDFVAQGRGLVFLGAIGTGKDHLLATMLYQAAILPATCHWINGQEFFGAFRDRIDTRQRDEDQFTELLRFDVLGISDPTPPAGNAGAWDLGNLYRLIDRRYRQMKSTWLTMNAQTVEDADAAISEPVFDRLRDDAEILECWWPSRRARKRKRTA